MDVSRRHRRRTDWSITAIALSIPVIDLSTTLKGSCLATGRKIETEAKTRSLGRQGSHHGASQDTLRYILIRGSRQGTTCGVG